MDALLLTLCVLLLLTASGLGPSLLLLPRNESPLRLIISPAVGLSTFILLSFALVRFGFTGSTIAETTLIILITLSVVALRISGPSRVELKRAVLPIAIGLTALALIAWPLFYEGGRHFIGYGNPDVPGLLQQATYLKSHPFGLYGGEQFVGYAYGVRPDAVLGMFYVMLIGSATTGVPIWVMFSVACAAMVAIAPLCTYVLCADGLRTSRCTAVGAALVLAASAQLANTFYLQSLGTLCVAAIGPLALALSLLACREFHLRITVLLAIVCGGMLFNYYPGAAVIMVLLASVVVTAVVASHITIKQALVLTCSVVAILLIVSVPYLGNIIRSLSFEMSGNMLIERSASEIQQTFALALSCLPVRPGSRRFR